MKTFSLISTAVAAASFLANSAAAQSSSFPSIVIKGSKFFYENNGTQFYIRGVAYQQDYTGGGNSTATPSSGSGSGAYIDPLSDSDSCKRDIPYLQQLRTNTIRVYAINPNETHDDCMQMLQDAGIYVIADLSSPDNSINRDSPAWNDDLYSRYTAVVDVMQKYPNTLGFFAGNEVSNNNTNTDASAFVKAAVRDMKSYIKQKGYRTIGVGYATNDDADIRTDLADYFDCGDRDQAIDFWGYNIYSWCGDSSYTESGYNVRTEEFSDYNVPAFFAEYGCNTVQPRKFTEVGALFGPQMAPVWSGGIVYMYFQESNDFGLVSVDGSSVSTLSDFNYLSSEMASANPTGVNSASYNPTNTAAQSCPSVGSDWQAVSALPPTPNQALCQCMESALSCIPNDVSDDDTGDLFGYICGLNDGDNTYCDGIAHNATTGDYGAYGMCNPQQQLGWVLNVYYNQQQASGNGASACDFSGSAALQSAQSPTGSCKALISQAGQDGQGTVTSAPTATAGSGSGSGSSGSGSGSGSGSSSSSSAGVPGFSSPENMGMIQVVVYGVVAFASAAGMILL